MMSKQSDYHEFLKKAFDRPTVRSYGCRYYFLLTIFLEGTMRKPFPGNRNSHATLQGM